MAIFSRYPIVASWATHLARNFSDGEDAHQRVVLAARIVTPSGALTVATSHWALSAAARRSNARDVWRFLQALPGPHVFTGDLNAEPDTPELRFLRSDAALIDAFAPERFPEQATAWTYTTHAATPKKRIDFVLYTAHHPLLQQTRAWLADYSHAQRTPRLLDEEHEDDEDDLEARFAEAQPSDHRPIIVAFKQRH